MRLTVVGCSGTLPGPGLAGSCYLSSTTASASSLDLGNGAIGALQRYVDLYDIDAVVLSATCTPTTASTCRLLRHARRYHPDGPAPRMPGATGPTGTAEPHGARRTTCPASRASTGEFDFQRPRPGRPRSARSGSRRAPGRTTRSRPTRCGSRPAAAALAYTGDTGAERRAGRARARRRPAAVRGVVPRAATRTSAGPAPHRRRRRREHAARAACGSWCSPTSCRGRPQDETLEEAPSATTATSLAAPGLTSTSEPRRRTLVRRSLQPPVSDRERSRDR